MENFRNHRINTYKAQLKVKGVEVTDEELTEFLNGDPQQIFNDNVSKLIYLLIRKIFIF